MDPDLPRIADPVNGRHGTVTEAGPAAIVVLWDNGWYERYTTAQVAAGRYLFSIPQPKDT